MRIRELCFFENGPLPTMEIWSKVENFDTPFQGRNRHSWPHPGKIREPNPEESASHHVRKEEGTQGPRAGRSSGSEKVEKSSETAPKSQNSGNLKPDPKAFLNPSDVLWMLPE